MKYRDYINTEALPTTWCPGCGNGMVLGAIARAFEEINATLENTVVVTGIGCWGKVDDYLRTNAFHGSHGRALALSTGMKLARPDMNIVVLMGDGDGVTIGGNHFIHAARRAVDVTAIIVNNLNYGMTGGQYSGTTPERSITTTSRDGHIEKGFDICQLAVASGAAYVARDSAENVLQLKNFIVEGMGRKGFSLIEAVTPCPIHYGRNNNMKDTIEMNKWIKENSISVAKAKDLTYEEKKGKFIMGKIWDVEMEDYSTKYKEVIERAKAGGMNQDEG